MSERWTPEIGQAYWVVDLDYSKKVRRTSWANDRIDNNCYSCNNCFKTKDEAETAAEKVKALLLSLHDPTTDGSQSVTDCNQLPDWCKVGEWVWNCETKDYIRITEVSDGFVSGSTFDGKITDEEWNVSYFTRARLRTYNAEEMRGLVGKVVTTSSGRHCTLVTACKQEYSVIEPQVMLNKWLYATDLLNGGNTIDGKPAGVFEHLENGEWVE